MGQPFPLPTRIPFPSQDIYSKMVDLGFQFGDSYCQKKQHLISYTLPSGWQLLDNSYRADIPEWYFVDTDNMCRFAITGSWKGTYDNELYISYINSPYPYVPRNTLPIPSETDGPQIISKIMDTCAQKRRYF